MTLVLTNKQAILWVRWIHALRLGHDPLNPGSEYRQGTDSLRCDGGYCCLGVACDLVDPDGWGYVDDDRDFITFDGDQMDVPTRVRLAFGVHELETGWNGWTPGDRAISNLNDSGSSFAELADIIEARLATAVVR